MTSCVVDDVVGTRDASLDADQDSDGCQLDSFSSPLNAGALIASDNPERLEATGFICPVGDQDWYDLSIPTGHRLVRAALSARGPMSPIQPTFAVYQCDDSCLRALPEGGEDFWPCCEVKATADPAGLEAGLEELHCLEPGDYFFVVSDHRDDNADLRYPRGEYVATLLTLPDLDQNELNESADDPARLQDVDAQSWSAEGQIACRGDQDWFFLDESHGADLTEGGSLTVSLDLAAPVTFQPQLTVRDDTLEALTVQQNLAAPYTETHLSWTGPILSPGPYYFVVEDDDGHDADTVAYDLAVSITPP